MHKYFVVLFAINTW